MKIYKNHEAKSIINYGASLVVYGWLPIQMDNQIEYGCLVENILPIL
jgi:hypothetical protein